MWQDMMKKQKKIAQNYIYQCAANLVAVLVPLIMTPYLSRVLGPEGIGISSYTGSVVSAFGMFAVLGAHDYGRLEIASSGDDLHKRSRVFWEIFLFKCGTCLALVPLYYLYVCRQQRYTGYLMLQSVCFVSILTDIGWAYQGMEAFRQLALRTIVARLASIVLILRFVRDKGDLTASLLSSVLTTPLMNLTLFIPLRRKLCRVKISELHPAAHTKSIFTFFLPILAAQLYLHIDKVMLGRFASSIAESAYYEQARKATEIITTLIVTINAVMVPRIARLYAHGETEQIRKHYQHSLRLILMLALPAAVGLFLISDHFVLWFFGEGYDKVAVLMKLSGVMIVFSSAGSFVGSQYLIPTRQQYKATAIYAITSCLNILMNTLLIPRLYSVGAMAASLLAEGLSCALQMALLLRSPYRFPLLEGVHRYLIGTVCMGAAVWAVGHTVSLSLSLTLLAEVAAGVAVYVVCLLVMREPVFRMLRKKRPE